MLNTKMLQLILLTHGPIAIEIKDKGTREQKNFNVNYPDRHRVDTASAVNFNTIVD